MAATATATGNQPIGLVAASGGSGGDDDGHEASPSERPLVEEPEKLSFSFKSYQDIQCDAIPSKSRDRDAAVRAGGEMDPEGGEIRDQQETSSRLLKSSSSSSPPPRVAGHSRRRSMDTTAWRREQQVFEFQSQHRDDHNSTAVAVDDFAASKEFNSLGAELQTKEYPEHRQLQWQPQQVQVCRQSDTASSNKCCRISRRQPQLRRHPLEASDNGLSETNLTTTRVNSQDTSLAMQSIHSLSMQLNSSGISSPINGDLQMTSSGPSSGGASAVASGPNNSSGASNKFSRLVGKKASRLKELVLQNLGKADKTHDEMFQIYEENFYKQQAQALRLQKEFKVYVDSLKGYQDAGSNLNSCIQQSTGDYQSARHDLVCENLSQLEHLSDDLMEKLRDQIVVSINEYLSQFNELRVKISKRKRKLIDFDHSRRVYEAMLAHVNKKRIRNHQLQQQQSSQQPSQSAAAQNFQALRGLRSAFSLSSSSNQLNIQNANESRILQSATSQLVDEARLLKMREQYNYCKIMYETINSELHEELPMIYEKKMKHLLMTLQNYFSLEAQFHSNAGKLYATISDVVDELPMSVVHSRPSGDGAASNNFVGSKSGANESYHKILASGASSSGMGSSRGDSSLESSSSPENDSRSGDHEEHQVLAQSAQVEEGRDEDEEVEAVATVGDAATIDGKDLELGDHQPVAATVAVAAAEIEEVVKIASEEVADKSAEKAPDANEASIESKISMKHNVKPKEVKVSQIADGDAVGDLKVKADSKVIEAQLVATAIKYRDVDSIGVPGAVVGTERASESNECLYKVKTNYKYLAEDVDELCFEADEIIQVVAFDENQEQEEGWLMGVREVNGQRGLFPANFTRPV